MGILDTAFKAFGYTKAPQVKTTVEKADREGIAFNPMAAAYQQMNQQYGLRKPNKITFQTLRRMAAANWVDRSCINTLRDELAGNIEWDVVPIDPKKPYDKKFQQYIIELLRRPNRNNENWRTFMDTVIEDILVVDAGTFEKVRDGAGLITELYTVDGASIKPCYDEHGMVGDPAYEQYLPDRNLDKPVAKWNNEDFTYIRWNPQNNLDNYGWGQCLPGDTMIETEEGKKRLYEIVNNKLSVKVKSYSKELDRITYEQVTNWSKRTFKQPLIRVDINSGGDGNIVRCTPDHPLLTQRGYVKASELTLQDKVMVESAILSEEQKQIIYGTLLGDASLYRRNNREHFGYPEYRVGHSYKQYDYLQWIVDSLSSLGTWVGESSGKSPHFEETGTITKHKSYHMSISPALQEMYDICYQDNKKTVTREWLDKVDVLGLATWIMDDGYISKDFHVQLYTNGFSVEECKIMVDWFKERWDIVAHIQTPPSDPSPRLALSVKVLKIIQDYITVEGREERPDNPKKWLGKPLFVEKEKSVVPIRIGAIKYVEKESTVYDIEVKTTHNFLVNGAVVHNSPVEAGLAVGTAFLYAEAYNLTFFKNNSIPAMIINMGKDVSPGEIDRFRMFLAAEMMGPQGFHTPVVTSMGEGFSVEPLLKDPADMAWQQYTEWQMRWKVALYRMSPQDIGFTLDQYKVEGDVQLQLSQNKAINSLKNLLAYYINTEVLADINFFKYSNNLQFKWIDTDVVDPVDQATVDKIRLSMGVNSINEIRQRDGLDPIVGGMQPTMIVGSQLVKVDGTEMMEDEDGNLQPLEKALPKGQKVYQWQSTQLDLPPGIVKQVLKFSNSIPDNEINTQQGGKETETHITVVYGLANYLTGLELKTFANQESPIDVILGNLSIFEQQGYDVLKINVESTGLYRLYEKIKDQLGAPGTTFPHYSPHVTVAYLKAGTGKKYNGDTRFSGTKIHFSELTFSSQDGSKLVFPFSQDSDVAKVFDKAEGEIVSLANNQSAVAWMDDRGVTQPLFITDSEKMHGFTVKSNFLDEKKGQEPPEAEVANLLRAMKANTPEVQIMTYEQVLQLLPTTLYSSFTNWIDLKPPFDSMEWRKRWHVNSRKSNYYIVTGFVSGTDLGDPQLQKEMATTPMAFTNAVDDLAKVWVAERLYYLGDRKPGHYIVTRQGNGYGVDYQFYKDEGSYNKTKHFLPKTLAIISPELKAVFDKQVYIAVDSHGIKDVLDVTEKGIKEAEEVEKSFHSYMPDNWEQMKGFEDIEKRFAITMQRDIASFYKKIAHIPSIDKEVVMQKANAFDPSQAYLTNGQYVWQNGIKYPISVLSQNQQPSIDDFQVNATTYAEGFNFGTALGLTLLRLIAHSIFSNSGSSKINIPANLTSNSSARVNPISYEDIFATRANLIKSTVYNTMQNAINETIVRGLDQGKTYGAIADMIQQNLGVDPNDPDTPQWRALRIARTESNWVINQGIVQQYKAAGVKLVDVSTATDACDECVALAQGNPYSIDQAGDLLPVHPNERCILIAAKAQP